MMKHQQHSSSAVRPAAGFLCVMTFVFGYSMNIRCSPQISTPAPISYSTAANTRGVSSKVMRAGLAERCSQDDIDRQVELFKVASSYMKSRWVPTAPCSTGAVLQIQPGGSMQLHHSSSSSSSSSSRCRTPGVSSGRGCMLLYHKPAVGHS
jgi:hypothetical protein